MITLTINNKEFKIANSYKELTLGQYIDIIKINDSKIKLESNAADIKIISILSDNAIELESLLWDFNIGDFEELTKHFEWVADTTLLDDFKKMTPKDKIIIDEKEFTILTNHNSLTLGEMVSFEEILKQKQSDYHRLDIAFGILLRPMVNGVRAKLTEETFMDVINNKYKVKMIDVYGVISFFLSGEKTYTNNSKAFSVRAN